MGTVDDKTFNIEDQIIFQHFRMARRMIIGTILLVSFACISKALELGEACEPSPNEWKCSLNSDGADAFCHWRKRVCEAKYSACDLSDAKLLCTILKLGGDLSNGACKLIRDQQQREDCENGSVYARDAVVQACAVAKSQICDIDRCPENKFQSAFCNGNRGLTRK